MNAQLNSVISSGKMQNEDNRIVICTNNVSDQMYNICKICMHKPCICFQIQRPLVNMSDLSQVYLEAFNHNVCPIKVSVFRAFLKDYDPELALEVIDIVQYGVHIPSFKVADPLASIPTNQKSTLEYE